MQLCGINSQRDHSQLDINDEDEEEYEDLAEHVCEQENDLLHTSEYEYISDEDEINTTNNSFSQHSWKQQSSQLVKKKKEIAVSKWLFS